MSNKRKAATPPPQYSNPPKRLDPHNFFDIVPDEDQRKLVDAVWAREKNIFLVDSMAGSGKTLMATALGVQMVRYGIYNKIVYVTFPGIYEKTQGFLPGSLAQKSKPYFDPLFDALVKIGEEPDKVCVDSKEAVEYGDPFIECAVSTFKRGINIENAFVIIDEAENATLHELAKIISRINDNCMTMVIGHSGQCDMVDKSQSGFTACIDYYNRYHRDDCAVYELTINHRGKVSQWADLMLKEYQPPMYGFVYMTVNKANGKVYIGKHKRSMDKEDINDSWFIGDSVNGDLNDDIIKHGIDNFKRVILCDCKSQQQLDYTEEIFYSWYSSMTDEDFCSIMMDSINAKEDMADMSRRVTAWCKERNKS